MSHERTQLDVDAGILVLGVIYAATLIGLIIWVA